MLSLEFHCHTHASKDSLTPPADLIAAARRKGIDRVVITDHNSIAGAREAQATRGLPRPWPTTVTAHEHWGPSFGRAAESAGLSTELTQAVAQLNAWLELVDQVGR